MEPAANGLVTHDSPSSNGKYSALLVSKINSNKTILKQLIRIPDNSRQVLLKGILKEDIVKGYANLLINFENETGDIIFGTPIISEKIISKKWKDHKIGFPVPTGAKKI